MHPRNALMLILLAAILAETAPLRAQAPSQPRDKLEAAWIDPQVGQPLPLDAQFTTHDGRPVHLREVFGR